MTPRGLKIPGRLPRRGADRVYVSDELAAEYYGKVIPAGFFNNGWLSVHIVSGDLKAIRTLKFT